MERVLDVLIFGDGPAARLAAIALSGLGLRVVRALPRPGLGPPPTARHSHILATTMGPAAAVLDRTLAQEIAARTEPQCRWRSFSGPDCAEYTAPRLSRAAVDAALDICIARHQFETWRDVQITGREGARLCAGSRQGQGCFDLVIDATGAHRATLPMLARLGLKIGYEDTGRVKLYQTLELALPEALPGVQWSGPALDGPCGALYGEIRGHCLRITASRGRGGARPITAASEIAQVFPPRIAALVPPGARLLRRTSTIAPQYRRLRLPERDMANWIALGDARAQWPPRLGTGLNAIFRQCRVLHRTLAEGGGPVEVRRALDRVIDEIWAGRATDLALRQ